MDIWIFLISVIVSLISVSAVDNCPMGTQPGKDRRGCESCAPGFFKITTGGASCNTHTKCPPGKYTDRVGHIAAEPECQTCWHGLFKDSTSTETVEPDSCIPHKPIDCPPGQIVKIYVDKQARCEPCETGFFKSTTSSYSDRKTDSCTVHTKCPPGKYTKAFGTGITQPRCAVCPPGFIKTLTSGSSIKTDSCIGHTMCPLGKYTIKVGTPTTQPECKACALGFFKPTKSIKSTCVWLAPQPGSCPIVYYCGDICGALDLSLLQ